MPLFEIELHFRAPSNNFPQSVLNQLDFSKYTERAIYLPQDFLLLLLRSECGTRQNVQEKVYKRQNGATEKSTTVLNCAAQLYVHSNEWHAQETLPIN